MRHVGDCMRFAVSLRLEVVALKYLIADLRECARECGAETEPFAITARRHRLAVDEAWQRFGRLAGIVAWQEDYTSIWSQVRNLQDPFYDRGGIRSFLPLVDDFLFQPAAEKDWKERHKQAAEMITALADGLQFLLEEVHGDVVEKGYQCEKFWIR